MQAFKSFIHGLVESKHLSTFRYFAPMKDNTARNLKLTLLGFAALLRNAHNAARGRLDTKIERFYNLAITRIHQVRAGQLGRDLAVRDMKDELHQLYHEAFAQGLRGSASGLDGRMTMNAEDERWVDSAFTHEMRFFNNFLDQALENELSPAQIEHRVRMYCDAVRSIYDAARVIGCHPDSLIYWIWTPEAQHCSSCDYLRDHSPYTKRTIPTTPRSGGTECLSNCRCHLRIVPASPDLVAQVERQSLNRATMLAHLNALKHTRGRSWRQRRAPR